MEITSIVVESKYGSPVLLVICGEEAVMIFTKGQLDHVDAHLRAVVKVLSTSFVEGWASDVAPSPTTIRENSHYTWLPKAKTSLCL